MTAASNMAGECPKIPSTPSNPDSPSSLPTNYVHQDGTDDTPVDYSGYDSCKGDFDYWFVKPYCEPDCRGKDYDYGKEKKKQKEYKPKHEEKKK